MDLGNHAYFIDKENNTQRSEWQVTTVTKEEAMPTAASPHHHQTWYPHRLPCVRHSAKHFMPIIHLRQFPQQPGETGVSITSNWQLHIGIQRGHLPCLRQQSAVEPRGEFGQSHLSPRPAHPTVCHLLSPSLPHIFPNFMFSRIHLPPICWG